MAGGDEALGDERMSQTTNDIFPKEEKEAAKRKKIAEMNAVTANAILKSIIDKYGVEHGYTRTGLVNKITFQIENNKIHIILPDSLAMKWKEILPNVIEFVSGKPSFSEITDYLKKYKFDFFYSIQKESISYHFAAYMDGITEICERLYPSYFKGAVNIPNGVTSIGKKAFVGCFLLKSINLPDGVTSIGESAFYHCRALESIAFPNGLTSIGGYAFECCKSLETLIIPNSVTSIGEEAFDNCISLTNITFGGTKEQWEKIKKGSQWNKDIPAETVHCTDGDVKI